MQRYINTWEQILDSLEGIPSPHFVHVPAKLEDIGVALRYHLAFSPNLAYF
jgi:hypothetical protein